MWEIYQRILAVMSSVVSAVAALIPLITNFCKCWNKFANGSAGRSASQADAGAPTTTEKSVAPESPSTPKAGPPISQ